MYDCWCCSVLLLHGALQIPFVHNPPASLVSPETGLNRSYGCQRIYSYYWFMIAMELVTLLGLTILSCMRLLATSGVSWLAWMTVLTALFIQGRYVAPWGQGGWQGEAR